MVRRTSETSLYSDSEYVVSESDNSIVKSCLVEGSSYGFGLCVRLSMGSLGGGEPLVALTFVSLAFLTSGFVCVSFLFGDFT